MHSHRKELAITTPSGQTKWNDAASYQTQAEYIDYIQSLSLKTQQEMAHAGVVVAQRMLASYFHDQKDYDQSTYWWKKAAENNDPVAILHQADVCRLVKLPDDAQLCCDRALDAVNDCKDHDFVSFIKEIAADTLTRIAVLYFESGLELHRQKDVEGAKRCWIKAADLGEPSAAYNVATMFKTTRPKDAIHYLDLVLFLSQQADNINKYRADAHNMLGTILAEALPQQCKYNELLEIITHFRKAIAYKQDPSYQHNLDQLMKIVTDKSIWQQLMMDSEPLEYKNGIIKTTSETLSHPNMSKEQVETWLQYQDPRSKRQKAAAKTSEQGMFAASVSCVTPGTPKSAMPGERQTNTNKP